MKRRWLVTGCSSGLGRALATALAEDGESLLATARRPQAIEDLAAYPNVVTAALDVHDPQACHDAVALAAQCFGGVDVLVSNAGYGQFGAAEEVSHDELLQQFDTNVFGPWRLVREVLPLWREQGSGHAVFVSSIASMVAMPGMAAYAASKAALEALAQSLLTDAGHLGVKSTILQLGTFATGYGEALREPRRTVEAYAPVEQEMVSAIRAIGHSAEATAPGLFAKLVRKVCDLPDPPLYLPFGWGVEEYLALAMLNRQEEFSQSLSEGRHLPGWVE
jgi:NAD(P)-dependent dehydrogenase (short-subunit alcohol dehydrogenase family)